MRFEIDFLESYSEANIVAELQRIAGILGKRTVTTDEIDQYGRVNSRMVWQVFGTIRKAHEAAGLVAARYTKGTDKELFKILGDLWVKTLRDSGRRPRASELKTYECGVCANTIMARFGTWKKALIATANAVDMPYFAKPVKAVKVVKRRRPLSVDKRYFILRRDRYRCGICRKFGGDLEVDHVIPVCRGGRDTVTNLRTLCKACNRRKGGKMP